MGDEPRAALAGMEDAGTGGRGRRTSPRLSTARWRVLEPLLDAALVLPTGERAAFVDAACRTDAALRAELFRMLDSCARDDRESGPVALLDRPAAAVFAGRARDAHDGAPVRALRDALAGRYAVGREVGRGGMGTVYLARDLRHDREVALKILAPELVTDRAAARFLDEIRVTARLRHPHVLPLYDSGEASGRPFYVAPYVAGGTLRERLAQEGPLSLADVLRVLRETASGLAHAHARGVVHRDVKPENVLLDEGGGAVLADFGIAAALARAAGASATAGGATQPTRAGVAVGTPAYMAPEQVAADPAVDYRADLYAWGLVAYELLTGEHPFAKRPMPALLAAHLVEMPAPLAVRAPGLPRAVTELVTRCLAKDPADRPPSARALVEALSAVSAPSEGTPDAAAAPAALAASTRGAGGPIPGAPPPRSSVAVLPLANTTGDGDSEHFSDGLTDELIGALSQVQSLTVTGRTSSFALKGRGLGVREIAELLGVATVLEGSVRRAGDRIKVRVQLVDADGTVRWSDAYDRRLTDVFAVQEEIARAVVRSLAVHLSAGHGPLVRPPTADLTAYDLFLRGGYLRRRLTPDDLRRAVGYLDQAVALDPSFARAYAALSDAHFLMAVLAGGPPRDAVSRARDYAERALALDAERADGHWARAQVLFVHEWDWARAGAEFETALALDPGSVDARHLYAIFLLCQGQFARAEGQLRRALTSEPLLPELHNTLARVYLGARRPERAVQCLHEALALAPAFAYARASLGHAYLAQGRYDDALAEFRGAAASGGAADAAQLAYACAACGRPDEARAVLATLLAPDGGAHPPPFQVAMALVGLGDVDSAFAWLERACEERDLHVAGLDVFRAFDPLRRDPRFAALLRRLGLAR